MTNKCTVPKLLGFDKWFQSRFGDLCEQHDIDYLKRNWSLKFRADYDISSEIITRGYLLLGLVCFIYCVTLGTLYFAWKKYL